MYSVLKFIHSYWAYLTLAVLLIAIINAFRARISKKNFQATDLRISLFALIFSHIQLLVGLALYFVSPWFSYWSDLGMGGVMKNSEARLYLVEHPTTNLIALFLITLGWSLHKRQTEDSKKFSRIAIFYSLGLVLLLSRIPWKAWL
jgi:heme A synthase